MAGSCRESEEVTAEVVLGVENFGPGGGRCQDLWNLLQGGIAGGAIIRLGDRGDDPPDRPNPGGGSPQGVPPADRDATAAQSRGDMGVSTVGGGDVGGGPGGGGDVHPPPPNTL